MAGLGGLITGGLGSFSTLALLITAGFTPASEAPPSIVEPTVIVPGSGGSGSIIIINPTATGGGTEPTIV